MACRLYAWADVTIEVICQEETLATRLDHCWHTFFAVTALGNQQLGTVVSLALQTAPIQHTSPPAAKQLWSRDNASVWQTADGLCLQMGATSLRIDLERGHASGCIADDFWHYPLADQRDFFMRSLLLLLRQVGIYGLHANGLSHHGQGLLLVGPSGSGKTTLTLSLLQVGWRALGDDVVALRQREEGITALALQRGFACTIQTMTFFPHLPLADAQQLETIRQKRWLAPVAAEAEPLSSACQPTLLLFPIIIDAAHSHLTPLDATQTMLGLMAQSAALLLAPRAAAQQMSMLRQLGRQAPSYRLALGRDVYTDPPAVAAMLGALSSTQESALHQ